MNKSLLTNLCSLGLVILGYIIVIPGHPEILKNMGFFALSGALTNWLAVHMLFEKIPFFYGSGVIVNRFEDFKKAIGNLIISEFFNEKNLQKFFQENGQNLGNKLEEKIDFDKVFNSLVEAIMSSNFAGLLSMIGGASALESLKEPIIEKLKSIIQELAQESGNDENLGSKIKEKLEDIINSRLDELTPQQVKKIVQDMIKAHLGWLVVWGGVVGALIGLLISFI